jgi:hypothetical protein
LEDQFSNKWERGGEGMRGNVYIIDGYALFFLLQVFVGIAAFNNVISSRSSFHFMSSISLVYHLEHFVCSPGERVSSVLYGLSLVGHSFTYKRENLVIGLAPHFLPWYRLLVQSLIGPKCSQSAVQSKQRKN